MGSAEHLTSWRRRRRHLATTGATAGAPEPRSATTRGGWLVVRAVLAALASAYLTLLATLVGWSVVPASWGWSTFVTDSGSMMPAVHVGDALVASRPPTELVPGQIVVVHDPAVPGRLLSHRLHRIDEDGRLVTKGDANAEPDSTPVPRDRAIGVVRLRVPWVGLPMTWWRSGDRGALATWAAASLLAVLAAATDPLRDRDAPGASARLASGVRRLARSRRPGPVVVTGTVVLALAVVSVPSAPTSVRGLHGLRLVAAKFSRTTGNSSNVYAAAPDFVAPDASAVVAAKTSPAGYLTGSVMPSAAFKVYANVSDTGSPASGVSTVRGDLSTVRSGLAAVALTSGTTSIGGTSYGWSSAAQTAGTSTGAKAYSLTMTDVAANSRTRSPYTLTVDGTAPTAVSVAGVNKTGGTAGKPETGDSLVLTYSEAVDPYSVLASWTGTSTPVTVRLTKSGSTGLLTVLVSGTALPLGSVLTDVFTNTTVDFTASTMTLSAGVVTVVLGTPTGAVNTSATTYNCSWTPAAGAFDAAGNPASTAARSETDNDKDF